VFGSGDCVEPEQAVARLQSGVEGVLVGRGVLRTRGFSRKPPTLLPGGAADRLARGSGPVSVRLHALLKDEGGSTSGSSIKCGPWILVHQGFENWVAPPNRDQQRRGARALQDAIARFFLVGHVGRVLLTRLPRRVRKDPPYDLPDSSVRWRSPDRVRCSVRRQPDLPRP